MFAFLDETGVKGIDNLEVDLKRPVILPHHHKVMYLIVEE